MASSPKQFSRFKIKRMTAKHPAMAKLRREGHVASIHGNKHWPSADLLMDFLEKHPLPKRKRVIDVGCGWGLSGIYCASTFKSKVLAVDADDAVFPYLAAHAELNDVKIKTHHGDFKSVKGKVLDDVHTVVGTDICFWDELVKPLYNVIKRALHAGAKRIVIVDPGRSPFFELAKKCEKKFGGELIDWDSDKYPQISGYVLYIKK
ncbi:MAG TPA: class I SAM-dependent methyltransferase [Spongiibacteraceae bacterium]|nr:class I SAM-dependent methyltransferase [Spongiibacteraceae bacterium]